MALNEELTWNEVGAISTGSGSVRDAFQLTFGAPTKELLSAGMSLYKFNGYSTPGCCIPNLKLGHIAAHSFKPL